MEYFESKIVSELTKLYAIWVDSNEKNRREIESYCYGFMDALENLLADPIIQKLKQKFDFIYFKKLDRNEYPVVVFECSHLITGETAIEKWIPKNEKYQEFRDKKTKSNWQIDEVLTIRIPGIND